MENKKKLEEGVMGYARIISPKKECYCCHKVKEGTVIIVDLKVRGEGENKVTETEARFVCHSCNNLKNN